MMHDQISSFRGCIQGRFQGCFDRGNFRSDFRQTQKMMLRNKDRKDLFNTYAYLLLQHK